MPEDMRISKLLRQLAAEKDPEQVKQVCRKLRIAIDDTTNGSYIRRSFDVLADSMMRVFKEGPLDSMEDVTEVLGLMGWVVRSEFPVYRTWLSRMYKVDRIRVWVMRALEHTLRMDELHREIRAEPCNRLIELLKDYLENIEKADLFVAVTNVISQFALNYPKQFQPHFPDIVDIVIGWHLETDQSLPIEKHCSQILQSFQPFWINDVTFTRNLLGQFLEDMVSYREETEQNMTKRNGGKEVTPPEICFGSIVGCTNSILKCICDSSATLSQHCGAGLLNDIFVCVLEVTQMTVEQQSHSDAMAQSDAICMGANELMVIIMDCYKFGEELPNEKLVEVVSLQLRHLRIDLDSKQKILAVLFVVCKLITHVKTKLPIALVQEIFSHKATANVHRMLFFSDKQIRKSTIRIYHAILNLKNVAILQEAYKLILEDFEKAMHAFCPDGALPEQSTDTLTYTKMEANYVITTYLSVLSILAISNSSIIVMWALQPTILEMLTQHLKASRYDEIWHQSPETHFSIMTLIVSHCRNNNNFIGSSSLLNMAASKVSDVFNKLSLDDSIGSKGDTSASGMSFGSATSASESSPTSAHFELILKFLSKILAQKRLSDHLVVWLLDWCNHLFTQSSQYSGVLQHNADFNQILESIVQNAAESHASETILKCGQCLDSVAMFDELNGKLLQPIAEICCIHMCSSDPHIRSIYSHIFGKLPLNTTLRQVNQFTGFAKTNARSASTIQHWLSRKPMTHGGGDMRAQYFSEFIRGIKISSNKSGNGDENPEGQLPIEDIIKNMFIHCWAHSVDFDETEELATIRTGFKTGMEFRNIAVTDIRSIISWAQWEAAQFCVNNKLRTVLGKPQETFLKIESIVKEGARTLSLKETPKVCSIETVISNQRNTRVLLGFMEALEKSIYNASEGTAVALPQADKPARTFFHINAPTCNEWFNRIRTAVDLVALHSMEPEMVIRYTEAVLKALLTAEKTNEPLFEHSLMSHAWALLRNGESDALHGLFTWTKSRTSKKVVWIKMVAGK